MGQRTAGAGYLITYRNQNNAQIFLTLQDQSRAALTKRGAVRSYAEHTLPKAGR